MARVQVGYNPGAEALQTTAAPAVRTITARQGDPNSSTAFQLAAALGAPSVQNGLAELQGRMQNKEEQDAKSWTSSQTVKQLGDAINDKKMLPSQSPLYVAVVSRAYGENARNQFVNETISKMNRGELKFASQEELEQYLVSKRNELLAGRDQYAVAGFDKQWGQVRESIYDANNRVLDKRFQEEGLMQASQGFATTYDDAKKSGADAATTVSSLMQTYELMRESKVLLTPEQQKQALRSIATTLAMDGNLDVLNKFLESNLPNNGPKVRFFVDQTGLDALQLQRAAEGVIDRRGREEADNGLSPFRQSSSNGELDEEAFKKFWEPRQKYIGSATIQSIIDHNKSVIARKAAVVQKASEVLVKANEDAKGVQYAKERIAAGQPIQDYTTADGRKLTAQDIGEKAMSEMVAANPNLSPQEMIRRYALSGVKNRQWEREINVAISNIGEGSVDANGKPVGQLMPATVEALDKFALVRQVSEGYARELAGSERNYKTLAHIQALRENGISDVNLAAALVNQKNRRMIDPAVWGNIQKTVNAEIEAISNPGVFTGRFWSEVFRLEMGEGEKNLIAVRSSVRELAETYLAAGVASDAATAVKKAAEYFADTRVTTQINKTIYLNKDLPDLPEGMDRVKWFDRSIDGVVGAKLKAQGIKFNRGDLTLIPQEGGDRPYMISLRQIPTGVYVTREEIKNWIMAESDKEIQQAIDAGNMVRNFNQGTQPNRLLRPEERPLMNMRRPNN